MNYLGLRVWQTAPRPMIPYLQHKQVRQLHWIECQNHHNACTTGCPSLDPVGVLAHRTIASSCIRCPARAHFTPCYLIYTVNNLCCIPYQHSMCRWVFQASVAAMLPSLCNNSTGVFVLYTGVYRLQQVWKTHAYLTPSLFIANAQS